MNSNKEVQTTIEILIYTDLYSIGLVLDGYIFSDV